jgi:putative isomerase
MSSVEQSPYLEMLKNRIDLIEIPFGERGSRVMVFRSGNNFSVRLAERWLKLSRQLTAYRERPALVDKWNFTDEEGNILDLQVTTYPHKIESRTRLGTFTQVFIDDETLLVSLPAGRFGLTFQTRMDKASVDRRGGILGLVGEIRRNMAYTTNARLLRNEMEPLSQEVIQVSLLMDAQEGSAFLMNITPRLGFNRHIPNVTEVIEKSARRWNDWFAAAPVVGKDYLCQYYFAWWVMRAGLISPRFYITREAMAPSKIRYVGVWQWDAYFHALAYRHMDLALARNQLRVFLDHQREDGMIPDAVHDEGIVNHLPYPVDSDVTKPPLAAWTTWKLHQYLPDLEFLNEIYDSLKRCVNWWFDCNDLDHNGLCEYQHPYSSGLDDNPLWDEGMPVESPDLNSYLYLELESLSSIAGAIGLGEEAGDWAERARLLLEKLLQECWDPQAGLFWARREGKRVDVLTPFSLYPLLTGHLPPEISERLVAHLLDEKEFWPRYPVPSVAVNDPHFDPQTMWRGPTWINVNFLLIEGLHRSGYHEVARRLRRATLEMMCSREDIYEYYNSLTGERPAEAAAAFGWSAAIFIDLALQDAADAGYNETLSAASPGARRRKKIPSAEHG